MSEISQETTTNQEARARKIAFFIALPVALLILIAPFIPDVASYIREVNKPHTQPLIINMSKTDLDSKILDDMISQKMYVSNYNVEVFVNFDNGVVVLGNPVRFTLTIKDEGIVKLSKPYFYVFIVNPDHKVRASFPQVLYQGELSIWGKWPQWSTEDGPQGFHKDAMRLKNGENEYFVPRSTLIYGNGKYVYTSGGYLYWVQEPTYVKLEFTPKEIEGDISGLWSIYTFVFDGTYVDRMGNKIESENAVCYSTHTFQVIGKSTDLQPTFDLLPFLSKLIPSSVASIGIFITISRGVHRKYTTLLRWYENIERERLMLIGIVMILTACLLVLLVQLFSLGG